MQSLVSVRLLLFVASLIIFGVSILLIQKNSHTRRGGDDFVRRNQRKVFGYILLFPAVLLLGLAALNDEMAIDSSVVPIDTAAAAAAQAYVPPVLSKPTVSLLAPKNTWETRMPSTNTTSFQSASDQPVASSAAVASSLAVPNSVPAPTPSHSPSRAEQLEAALAAATAKIQANPKDSTAYGDRGNLYAAKRDWDAAARDYQSALAIDDTNAKAKFNLAEMSFMKKNYEPARIAFVGLESDPDFGDLAAYKAFLCDLFGGQLDPAQRELDAFNQVGSNASYYFANAAWSINHRKPEEARDWLKSASRIYPPEKFKLYATTLFEMGYLPLPPPPPSN
jgi:hypothetical protein